MFTFFFSCLAPCPCSKIFDISNVLIMPVRIQQSVIYREHFPLIFPSPPLKCLHRPVESGARFQHGRGLKLEGGQAVLGKKHRPSGPQGLSSHCCLQKQHLAFHSHIFYPGLSPLERNQALWNLVSLRRNDHLSCGGICGLDRVSLQWLSSGSLLMRWRILIFPPLGGNTSLVQ